MSRSSPLVAPIMDEDFDLCISETNLPFPYSDHCSTGPPSLYEFDVNDDEEEEGEEGEEGEEEYGEDDEDEGEGEGEDEDEENEDEGEEFSEDDVVVRKEVLVDDDSDEDSTHTSARLNTHRPKVTKTLNDLPRQLQSRLEKIHDRDVHSNTVSASPIGASPRYARRSLSFDSTGEWQAEEEEEEEDVVNGEQQQDKGLFPTVTTAVTSVAYAVGKHWSKKIYESLLRSRDPKAYYTHLLSAATNYEQWASAAATLDRLQGKDKWKNDPTSPHYDYEMLQERLSQLASARESGDLGLMIFLLRTSLSRNLGNVGRPQLYAETIIGTKRLIEDYNSEVIRQLNIICDTESDDFSTAAKLEFFTHTRQAFGRTALLLSGGATMGVMHIGVIKTLYDCQVLPRIISGSSCGSIIAAILCTCTDEEIPSMLQFDKFNFTFFHTVEEQGDHIARLIHFLKNGALFDAQVLKAALKDNIGDATFQEAYNRTRRILNVTVSTSATFEMPRLLNYLTAPNVLIWSAVATSCAAPFIYNSAPLMAKDKNGEEVQWNPSRYHWIDGSVENDLPMNKLSELFNVNHFIVCQVNPYIVPFLHNSLARSPSNRVVGWMLYQARSELQHRMNQLSLLGVMPELINKVQAIMSQRYYGDITIVPDLGVDDYLNIVSNPTVDSLVGATLKGERATWPKISIIKNHCSIEHTLDDILYRLRLRRLEAYRAYPQVPAPLTKMPRENPAYIQPAVQARPSSSTTALRSSVSVCLGAVGRSNSSPGSPTNSVNTSMGPSGSPLDQLNRSTAKSASTESAVDHYFMQGLAKDNEGNVDATQANGSELQDTTTSSTVGTVLAVDVKLMPRRNSSGGSHSRPQSLKRTVSSSEQSHSPVGSPLIMRTSSRSSTMGVSTVSNSKFGPPTLRGPRNSAGNGSEYQRNSDTTTNTAPSSRRSSSSSMSSSHSSASFSVVSGASLTKKETAFFLSSPVSESPSVFPGPSMTMPAYTTTVNSTPNTPVPVVVHTNNTNRSASSNRSSSKTRSSGGDSGGAGGSSGSPGSNSSVSGSGSGSGGSNRIKKNTRSFHMTSLQQGTPDSHNHN
ncbi:acyl transferase/acyl hydrolase/lysophospholipase [Dissophora ornata]|nr:acyl transferase/acyl hydrolase/lysophospholipase [Dissophora ornata]